jgi:glycosyltransferase involved in cell wall biosynthesis
MQKVLIVTYYWPPGSGAGVQRWLKFSKYLPQYGWEPVILTIDPDFAAYPAIDYSMINEVPDNLIVYKTKAKDYFRFYKKDKSKIPSAGFADDDEKGSLSLITRFIRGNFFIPDPRRGWNKYAFKKACEIIEELKINHVITTSPPHSTQLIGLKLKRKYPELKWISDLRDPWTDIYYYKEFYPTYLSKSIDSACEKRVLESADRIVTVGKSLRELFSSKIPGIKEKIEIISNGYDNEDFSGLNATLPDVFTISYVGTLSDKYHTDGLLNALRDLRAKGTDFRLRFTGFVSARQRELIISYSLESNTEFLPYADHSSAVKCMLGTSILLLLIPDHHSSKSIITGKLFEYLASGKPVISLGPVDGDAAEILAECGHGKTFDYNDTSGIFEYLKILMKNPQVSEITSPAIYRRDNLVQRVVTLLT